MEAHSQHESRVKNSIYNARQYFSYIKDHLLLYDDNDAVISGGRNKNENLCDYPVNYRGYDIQHRKIRIVNTFVLVLPGQVYIECALDPSQLR